MKIAVAIAEIAAKFANCFVPLSKLYSANWRGVRGEVLTTFPTQNYFRFCSICSFSLSFPQNVANVAKY